MEAKQSMPMIEQNLQNAGENQIGYEELPQKIVQNIREISRNSNITAVTRRINFGSISNIFHLLRKFQLHQNTFPNL